MKKPSWPTYAASERRIADLTIIREQAIRRASLPRAARTPCKGGASYHVFALGAGECSMCGAIR